LVQPHPAANHVSRVGIRRQRVQLHANVVLLVSTNRRPRRPNVKLALKEDLATRRDDNQIVQFAQPGLFNRVMEKMIVQVAEQGHTKIKQSTTLVKVVVLVNTMMMRLVLLSVKTATWVTTLMNKVKHPPTHARVAPRVHMEMKKVWQLHHFVNSVRLVNIQVAQLV